MKLKYLKRYNKFNFYSRCRICLTQGMAKSTSLREPLKGEGYPVPLVYEALEYITNEKVVLSTNYPSFVCGMCLGLLNISYDLFVQYRSSEKDIIEKLKKDGLEVENLCDKKGDGVDKGIKNNQPAESSPAEIIVGSQKFSIKDLLIIEDENEEATSYDGFLKNLGKSISASFVDKRHKKSKPHVEPPSLVIEKVQEVPGSANTISIPQNVVINTNGQASAVDDNDDVDEFIIIDRAEKISSVDAEIMDDQSKEMVESALKMKYTCRYCSKPLSSLTRAKIHSQKCHKNNSDVTCYVCEAKFGFRKQLLKHIRDTHLKELGEVEPYKPVKYKCKICSKVLRSTGSYSYHMSTHGDKNYCCDKCEKSFCTKSQLCSHIQTHRKDKTVVICPICGKGFHYKSGLHYHMKMHNNERNIECNYCPRRFYSRNAIKRHELTHTGARPYPCQYCDKRFRSLGEVKKHELLHTGERPYQCKYCNSGFTQLYSYKLHLTTHPGDYVCGHCCKGFPEMDILRFHLRTKHQMEKGPVQEVVVSEGVANRQGEVQIIPGDGVCVAQDELIDEEFEDDAGELNLGEGGYYVSEQYEVQEAEDGSQQVVLASYSVDGEVLVETVRELD